MGGNEVSTQTRIVPRRMSHVNVHIHNIVTINTHYTHRCVYNFVAIFGKFVPVILRVSCALILLLLSNVIGTYMGYGVWGVMFGG